MPKREIVKDFTGDEWLCEDGKPVRKLTDTPQPPHREASLTTTEPQPDQTDGIPVLDT